MRQLILDLLPEAPPTLDNFVPGGNEDENDGEGEEEEFQAARGRSGRTR